ncbi:MAG: putative quinol monooxygenase [Desulfobacterales bacterium]
MVPVIAKLGVKEGHMGKAVEMVKKLVVEVAKEDGTLIYKFCKDPKNPNMLVVMEAYKDGEALKRHSSTPHFNEFFASFSTIMDGSPEIMILEEIASI